MVAVDAEPQLVGLAEMKEHIQLILLTIESFTHKMLELRHVLFKDLTADFDECLCSIHRERVERWEEEIRELCAHDSTNEQIHAFLHNTQL